MPLVGWQQSAKLLFLAALAREIRKSGLLSAVRYSRLLMLTRYCRSISVCVCVYALVLLSLLSTDYAVCVSPT